MFWDINYIIIDTYTPEKWLVIEKKIICWYILVTASWHSHGNAIGTLILNPHFQMSWTHLPSTNQQSLSSIEDKANHTLDTKFKIFTYIQRAAKFWQNRRGWQRDHMFLHILAYMLLNLLFDAKSQFKLTQLHLIQCLISSIELSDSRLHGTPAEPGRPLPYDFDGLECAYL